MSEWLKKWYNNQFEKIDASPSSKVWENISESLEEWPKHWYNSNTNHLRTEPRPSTWQSIQSQIVNYPAGRARPAYVLISIATVLLSLIPISVSDGNMDLANSKDYFLANIETDNHLDEFNPVLKEDNERSSQLSNKQNVATNSIEISEKEATIEQRTRVTKSSNTDLATNKLTSEETIQSKPNIKEHPSNKSIVIDTLFENNFDMASLTPSIISYPELNPREDLIFQPKDVFKPNYSIGLHVTPQFSSHLNPLRTKIMASNDAEIMNPLSIGFDLSFEKYISSKNSLRLNLRGNNVKSLKFKEQNIAKEMTLNYLSLDLTYSRKWSLGNSDKLYLKTNIGVFAGYAVSKGVNYNGERIAYIEDGLRNMDFGNSAGLILSRKLPHKMRLEVGAISQFGVMNIFKGTDVLPSNFFRSSTVSYGLSLGVIKEF